MSLRGCGVGPWGAHFIASGVRAAGASASLEMLRLNACRLRADGCAAMASLLTLDGSLAAAQARTLEASPPRSPHLRPLPHIPLSPSPSHAFPLHPLARSSLLELELSGNAMGDAGLKMLAAALGANTSLEVLRVAHNRIGATKLPALAAAVAAHPTLRVLDVSHNQASRHRLLALLTTTVLTPHTD